MNRDPRELRTLAAILAQPEDDALDALRDLLPQAPWLAEGNSGDSLLNSSARRKR
jgi:hypothetical protein